MISFEHPSVEHFPFLWWFSLFLFFFFLKTRISEHTCTYTCQHNWELRWHLLTVVLWPSFWTCCGPKTSWKTRWNRRTTLHTCDDMWNELLVFHLTLHSIAIRFSRNANRTPRNIENKWKLRWRVELSWKTCCCQTTHTDANAQRQQASLFRPLKGEIEILKLHCLGNTKSLVKRLSQL